VSPDRANTDAASLASRLRPSTTATPIPSATLCRLPRRRRSLPSWAEHYGRRASRRAAWQITSRTQQ
jgi:hypothetical protein